MMFIRGSDNKYLYAAINNLIYGKGESINKSFILN